MTLYSATLTIFLHKLLLIWIWWGVTQMLPFFFTIYTPYIFIDLFRFNDIKFIRYFFSFFLRVVSRLRIYWIRIKIQFYLREGHFPSTFSLTLSHFLRLSLYLSVSVSLAHFSSISCFAVFMPSNPATSVQCFGCRSIIMNTCIIHINRNIVLKITSFSYPI